MLFKDKPICISDSHILHVTDPRDVLQRLPKSCRVTGTPDVWQLSWQAVACNSLVWLYDGSCCFCTVLSTPDLLCHQHFVQERLYAKLTFGRMWGRTAVQPMINSIITLT